jgi:hypothetical protein
LGLDDADDDGEPAYDPTEPKPAWLLTEPAR